MTDLLIKLIPLFPLLAVIANGVELPLKPYGFTTVRLKFGRP